jgi:hypothetical protein
MKTAVPGFIAQGRLNMEAKQQLEQSMSMPIEDERVREALNAH